MNASVSYKCHIVEGRYMTKNIVFLGHCNESVVLPRYPFSFESLINLAIQSIANGTELELSNCTELKGAASPMVPISK